MKERTEYLYPVELVEQRRDDLRTKVEGDLGADVIWAQLVLTEKCSRRCIMCDYWQSHPQNELSTDEVKTTLSQLRDLGTQHVIFLGGEALLRRDLLEIIQYTSSLGIAPELVTSGFDTPNKVRSFVEAGLRSYIFSIDGPTPQSHNTIRGFPRLWENLVQSINNLREISTDDPDIKIKTQTVAMKQNLFELDQVIELVGSLRVHGVSIMPVKGVPNLVPTIEEVKKYNNEVAPKVAEVCKKYNFQVTRLSIYPFGETSNEIQRAQKGLYNLGSNKIPCIVPWTHTLINPDGAVYTCCSMYSHKLGNIKEKSISEIWQDEPYRKLRQQMRKLQLPECVSCIERNDYEAVSQEAFSKQQ
ncbi:radical SAM protein [Candidatus Parcubacteria bacterium]|nr:MAG: radical SAM protein [Candidatus Parcubacteria bacterium]